ncbi:unnamed protein product [Cylindrotheca closterium]|uniref:STI1 domain-containing protein n=1 Tax=Cylindrotheca closterium TaxID=2856 RepID=A0AAD2FT38_9STRA|nr:unnamed protein product [Cylindrotheca closterium]
MRISFTVTVFALLNGCAVQGFTTAPRRSSSSRTVSSLSSAPSEEDQAKRMQEILAEEANNKTNMKAAAQAMKNIKPEDMNRMLEEMENMNPLQQGALKAMGMDPAMMKKTMEMMRDNPKMVESAQKLMENMSPAELLEQSQAAQKRMANMTPEALEETSKAIGEIPQEQLDQAVGIMKEQQVLKSEETAVPSVGPTSDDNEVIDSMFKVAELMSEPATGGCTFAGFASLPVIQMLSGDREFDLSPKELRECWADGALGASRVDREGFERVWKEVQDYFEDDIMGEARKEAKKRVQKKARPTEASSASAPTPTTTIGEGLNPDQIKGINEKVKNLSDNEVDAVLDQMDKMGPAEEARMKAMGVDPSIMKKTAEMMKSNPMMRKAAQEMMKNMSPEQMLEASKQAQQQMQGMSKEDIEKAMDLNRKK